MSKEHFSDVFFSILGTTNTNKIQPIFVTPTDSITFIISVVMEHTESLRKQVEEQGNVVRELKAQKAPKEEISTALNKLFSLKTELKEAEQMEIGNLLEEIQKLKLENGDETLIKEKEERVSQLQKLVEPEPEKKPKEKKVLEQ